MQIPHRISGLKAAEYNPRAISKQAFSGLKHSVEKFGDISGIVFNQKTGNLVCGHQRVKALAEKFGDCDIAGDEILLPDGQRFRIRVVDWDEATEKAANVAANNPHIAGKFTPDLQLVLEEISFELPEQFSELRFEKLKLDFSDSNEKKTSTQKEPRNEKLFTFSLSPEEAEKADKILNEARRRFKKLTDNQIFLKLLEEGFDRWSED